MVDTLGLLLVVMATAASVTDRESGRTLLARPRERHWPITLVWADGGTPGAWSTLPAMSCGSP
ncbi:hypothetical protein ACFVX9_16460 [Kitasatospora sp. NPDC058243]|uniref:hypothetical protein n=1 Tax=Kitasatospora sp. NPDC058243 TaxID=3346397 RepID=UPI0036DD7179